MKILQKDMYIINISPYSDEYKFDIKILTKMLNLIYLNHDKIFIHNPEDKKCLAIREDAYGFSILAKNKVKSQLQYIICSYLSDKNIIELCTADNNNTKIYYKKYSN